MKLKWLGTASILLEHEGTQLLFDPFLSINEKTFRPDISELAAVENILVTHGHLDHIIDIPTIIKHGDGGTTVWCTKAPGKALISRGISGERIRIIKPGDALEFPPFEVRVLKGKHIRFDIWQIVKTLLSPRMIKYRKNLSYMRKQNKANVEAGETVIYDISVSGEHILLLGSLNLEGNTEYPVGVDLLILPFQGRSDITGYAMQVVGRLQPRKILLDHFDDTFPPISSSVRTGRFVKKMQRDFPAVPVICRPAGSEWIV